MQQKQTRIQLERALRAAGNPDRAVQMARYFRTGKGEHGEGDVFIGIATPALRRIALQYKLLPLNDLQKLLNSKIHEHRSGALEILAVQFMRGDETFRKEIVNFYLRNTGRINNWDLVDMSCRCILGEYLKTRPRRVLRELARSESLWERRIAMVSTMALVWDGDLEDAIEIAEMLLDDKHDLIHKAVGWVLREAGRKDRTRLLSFLERYYSRLPRTTLRYAIEHFSPEERRQMMTGKFLSPKFKVP